MVPTRALREGTDPRVIRLFGAPTDPMVELERRAAELFPGEDVIVWEGDPSTFRFSFVGAAAERVLGHPCSRWTGEPTFWTDVVVHPEDRRDAVAYCALATCKGADHVFEYRAHRRDGGVVWLLDVVRVVLGERNLPVALRGVMFDISQAKRESGTFEAAPAERTPSTEHLATLPDAAA